MLSQVTRLLALVSAPPLEAATVRHVEVLLLQPDVVMVVVITSTGGVTKRATTFGGPSTPASPWAGEYLNERSPGCTLGTHRFASGFDEPSLSARERAFLPLRPPSERCRRGAAPLRRRRGRPARRHARRGDRRVPAPDRGAREARRAARLLRGALDPRRPFVRVGDELEQPGLANSRSSARRTGSRTGLSARSACSARCAWTTRRRSARCARPPPSSRASSRRSTSGS